MRTYGPRTHNIAASRQQRAAREATEWDIRVDVNEVLTAERVVSNLKEASNELLYVLVSGVERPDNVALLEQRKFANPGSTQDHVHVCVVLRRPGSRFDVLKIVRGLRKLGDEYAAPRNAKFAYAGWVIHHAKSDWKIDGEPDVRYEYGDLPMDPFTTEWAVKIESMLKRYGSDTMRARFRGYTDLISRDTIKMQIEKLQMQLEDRNAE